MTPQEAKRRIKEHNEIHSKNERFAIYITEALNMAVEALEKQIPKKLTLKHRCYAGSVKRGVCPNCLMTENNNANYCRACGQALDWSDTE